METKPLRFFSHSRVAQDENCPRSGYLAKEWGGTGLLPLAAGWDLTFGNLLHKYLYHLAKSQSMDFKAAREEILVEGQKVLNLEQAQAFAASGEGLLRGFVKSVWPVWMGEFEVYSAEGLVQFEPYEGFMFRAIKDLILKNKHNGRLRYVDYKSTSSNSPEWVASWSRHPQIHTSMYATQKAEKIQIDECVVVGLYKGYMDERLGVKRNSMNYGWVNREYPMSPSYRYEYTRAKGWELFPTFHEWPDLEGWVQGMPQEQLSKLYPQTGPIFLRDDIAESWFRQQKYRQREIGFGIESMKKNAADGEYVEMIMDETFPQRFQRCKPQYGYGCPYEPLCWNKWIGDDPLGSGQFVRNEAKDFEEMEA